MHRILVIDDDALLRDTVITVLRAYGFTTLEAASGSAGLASAHRERPDLIISDLYMAHGDGYDLLKALRADPRTAGIPLVLMTGLKKLEDMHRGMELGADDCLLKPFTPQALIAAVNARFQKQQISAPHHENAKAGLQTLIEAADDLVAMFHIPGMGSQPPGSLSTERQTGTDGCRLNYSIFYLNRSGRRMLGLGEEEDVSRLQATELHPAWAWERLRKEGIPTSIREGVWRGETALLTRAGEEIPVSQLVLSNKAADGALEYFSTIARDMSEQKRQEKERSLLEIQLRQARKLERIGQLAAGIAHEIATPTQFIGDNVKFLQEAFGDLSELVRHYGDLLQGAEVNDPPQTLLKTGAPAKTATDIDIAYLVAEIPKAIQQSLEGVERVAKIVRAMKDFSHPGNLEKTPADLNKIIDSTLIISRHEWKYVADMITDYDPNLPSVPCFPGEFSQVILNLIVNATHAIADVVGDGSNGKGTIMISTKACGEAVEIRVSDTGTGIPENARNHIFEPFFTTKEAGKGTGQGLAIARSVVVAKHGGTLTFETAVGLGTTFTIRLPLAATPSGHAEKKP